MIIVLVLMLILVLSAFAVTLPDAEENADPDLNRRKKPLPELGHAETVPEKRRVPIEYVSITARNSWTETKTAAGG